MTATIEVVPAMTADIVEVVAMTATVEVVPAMTADIVDVVAMAAAIGGVLAMTADVEVVVLVNAVAGFGVADSIGMPFGDSVVVLRLTLMTGFEDAADI